MKSIMGMPSGPPPASGITAALLTWVNMLPAVVENMIAVFPNREPRASGVKEPGSFRKVVNA